MNKSNLIQAINEGKAKLLGTVRNNTTTQNVFQLDRWKFDENDYLLTSFKHIDTMCENYSTDTRVQLLTTIN